MKVSSHDNNEGVRPCPAFVLSFLSRFTEAGNGGNNKAASEKLSNISSEDIDMNSATGKWKTMKFGIG